MIRRAFPNAFTFPNAFPNVNDCQTRFWHRGQRVKGMLVLAVSSNYINGRVAAWEGAHHAAWTAREQQKLEMPQM